MFVFHGIWSEAAFHLWAEVIAPCLDAPQDDLADSAPPEASPVPNLTFHPGAVQASRLREMLGELIPDGLLVSAAEASHLTTFLPCEHGAPLPSTQETIGLSERSISYCPYVIQSLRFSPADAIDLLLGLPKGRKDPAMGHSIEYFAHLARYVVSVVHREQFVPFISRLSAGEAGRPETSYAARWRLSIQDKAELAWLESFSTAMPPLCRAFVAADGTLPRAAQIINDFMALTSDAIIRRGLESDSFFQQVHERALHEPQWELRWLSALIGDNRYIRGQDDENSRYSNLVHGWVGRIDEGVCETPPRLVVKLVEPVVKLDADDGIDPVIAGEEDRWSVEFCLFNPDTDRMLDLQTIWNPMQAGASAFNQHRKSLREHYLSELNRAAELFPAIRSALRNNPPRSVDLDTAAGYAFIRQTAPLLSAHGFRVILPIWATDMTRRLGMQLHVSPADSQNEPTSGGFGLNTLLNFNWRIALGDQPLSAAEIRMIADAKAPLVRLRNQWIDLDQEAARQAVQFVDAQQEGRITLAQALRMASGVDEVAAGLPVMGLTGAEWIDQFLAATSDQKIESLPQPDGFKGSLRPYQRRGLDWLAFLDRLGIGGCLADDMGLGKTVQLIALLMHERREGAKVGPTLLFAPMSIVGNWQRECERFASQLRILVHHGPFRLADTQFVEAAREADLVITTYGLARRDIKDLRRIGWHRIVLDEAQKVKNPAAAQSVAIRSLAGPRCIALTGTPLENHLSELWSIMEMLNPGLLGSAALFRKQFALPIERLGDHQRAAQLRNMIRPFVLRRLKTDPNVIRDLPDKLESKVFCNLTPEQAALYNGVVNDMLEQIDAASGIRRRGLILATLTKLKQIANHPAHFLNETSPLDDRSGKCERLMEMIEEVVEEGGAALVFTQYRVMGDLLKLVLQQRLNIQAPFLHGGTSAKQREEMIAGFQKADGPSRIFLLSLKAGGLGLNLTRANHVFHYDRWWNPAVEQQATDRAYRIGQTRRVHVHKFVCIGTIEDRIDQILTEKASLAENIVGSGDEWLTSLSTNQLREYLTLSPEAVAES